MKFLLYATCKIVLGAKKAILMDLERGRIQPLPLGVAQFLESHMGYSLEEMIREKETKEQDIIKQNINFLIKNDYGFFTDVPERFPSLPEGFSVPALISNAIIDINNSSNHKYRDILASLEGLGCRTVDFRMFFGNKDELSKILDALSESRIKAIRLILPHGIELEDQEVCQIADGYDRIQSILIHGALKNRITHSPRYKVPINHRTLKITGPECCGVVYESLMISNIKTYMESKEFNNCLNRKLTISKDGLVTNCSQMSQSFGHIASVKLRDVVTSPEFQAPWSITKDQVDVCRDCEYRYACIDCRAITKSSTRPNPKPKRCTYNPYTGEWQKGNRP